MLKNESVSKLSPFALQAETSARYLAVLTAFIVFIWILVSSITKDIESEFILENSTMIRAAEKQIIELSLTLEMGQVINHEQYSNLTKIQNICRQLFWQNLRLFLVEIVYVSIFIFFALLYYFLHPAIMKYRNRAIELPPSQNSELRELIYVLARSVGISKPPKILIGGLSADAQVYGFGGHYVIRLGQYSGLLYERDYRAFETMILHELAHILNKDILPTYMVQGMWFSAIVASVINLTYFFTLYGDAYLSYELAKFVRIILQVFGYLLILRIIIFNLLRVREHYADWRVASWGHQDKMEKLLRDNLTSEPYLVSLWKWHPLVAERLSVLEKPSKLFHLNFDLVFFAGILTGMLLSHFQVLWNHVLGAIYGYAIEFVNAYLIQHLILTVGVTATTSHFFYLSMISNSLSIILGIMDTSGSFFTALLMSGIIGIQVQRLLFLNLVNHTNPLKAIFIQFGLAFCMALGVEIGFALNLVPVYILASSGENISLIRVYFFSVPTFSLIMIFWFILVSAMSYLFLASRVGKEVSIFRQIAIMFLPTILLWILYEPFNFLRLLVMGPYQQANYLSDINYLTYEIIFALFSVVIFCGIIFLFAVCMKLSRLIFPLTCPNCRGRIRVGGISVVNKYCTNCGCRLSSWLYISELADNAHH